MQSEKYFSVKEILKLRKPVEFPNNGPEGWSKCKIEPGKLLKNFSALRIKKGFVLRTYHFREGGNGNAIVWAMPKKSSFPPPESCMKLMDKFLQPPKPEFALDDFMEAIDGDMSHWSYLSASIFMREVSEFGALWHGHNWCTHEIIESDPFEHINQTTNEEENGSSQNSVSWTWLDKKPAIWQPSVCINDVETVVKFYSYSELETKAIYSHTDTFVTGQYTCKSENIIIAKSGNGYCF
jgi:hypothetical protein